MLCVRTGEERLVGTSSSTSSSPYYSACSPVRGCLPPTQILEARDSVGGKIQCKNRKLLCRAFMLVAQKFQHVKDIVIAISILFLVRPSVDLLGVSRWGSWWDMWEGVAFSPHTPLSSCLFSSFLSKQGWKEYTTFTQKNRLHEVFHRQTMTNEHIERPKRKKTFLKLIKKL